MTIDKTCVPELVVVSELSEDAVHGLVAGVNHYENPSHLAGHSISLRQHHEGDRAGELTYNVMCVKGVKKIQIIA